LSTGETTTGRLISLRRSASSRVAGSAYHARGRLPLMGMSGSDYVLTRTLVIALLLAVLLTVVVAPALVSVFRRKVTVSMKRTARAAAPCSVTAPAPAGPVGWPPAGYGHGYLPRILPGTSAPPNPRQQALSRHTHRTLNRLALAYGCGGAAQATVMPLFVLLGKENVYTRPLIWLSMWLVMALPVAATVSYVLSARPAMRALWVVAALAAALVVSGAAGGLVWAVFQLYILLPAVLFLLFKLLAGHRTAGPGARARWQPRLAGPRRDRQARGR
jgi:hypothetical protein